MGITEKFGHFEIARGSNGLAVELSRSPDEVVFLAFDTKIKRLVELHVLNEGGRLQKSHRAEVCTRMDQAIKWGGRSFMKVLAYGEDEDVFYYASSLNDGEPLEDYITRRRVLPPATIFSLVLQLLDDLIALQSAPNLFSGVNLKSLLLNLQEDSFLELLVLDYGLTHHIEEQPVEEVKQRLVRETCEVIFLMLTAKVYEGDDCDKYAALTGLPSGLRSVLRSSLMTPDNAPASLERLRDETKDALAVQARDLQGRSNRRHLVATEGMVPKSLLSEVLLNDVKLSQSVAGRLNVSADALEERRHAFIIPATDPKTDAPLTVHLLPPRRIVSNEHYEAVPLQVWRFTDEKHPNILRSRGVWESPDFTYLIEEGFIGLTLGKLMAGRIYLNPAEVLILLKQVAAGLSQALECGVEKVDIHPGNIFLKLLSPAPPHPREMEKLLQKRLEAWPKFLVLLRPHMTMRHLYEPLLVDSSIGDDLEVESQDFRNRSFAALAAYLLSGERQSFEKFKLPDSVPDDLSGYIRSCLNTRSGTSTSIKQFMEQFEHHAAIPDSDSGFSEDGLRLPTRTMGTRAATTASSEPMESAGSVSDFEEDFIWDEGSSSSETIHAKAPVKSKDSLFGRKSLPTKKTGAPKGRKGVLIWAAAFAVLVLIVASLFSSGGEESAVVEETETSIVAPAKAAIESSPEATLNKIDQKKAAPAPVPEEIRKALLPTNEERRNKSSEPDGSPGPRKLVVQEQEHVAGRNP